jgi:hypothetical protein
VYGGKLACAGVDPNGISPGRTKLKLDISAFDPSGFTEGLHERAHSGAGTRGIRGENPYPVRLTARKRTGRARDGDVSERHHLQERAAPDHRIIGRASVFQALPLIGNLA